MIDSLDRFVRHLIESGLMSAAEFASFQNALRPEERPRDVKDLITVLFRAGKLTKYQARAIYEGKGKSLVFDEYVVLDQIGEGGMGVVLKAQHRRMKRLVAVKMLPAAKMKTPGAMERFHREVEAAAKLSHPNIVASHDAREQSGTLCLVMEYVEGSDLAQVVKAHGPLPVTQAVDFIRQAAHALQYAHSKGVVHRDIKPGNLLLDKEGVVKVLDMGLARITRSDTLVAGQEQLTATGQVMGTCDYMAPEQAFDVHNADHRADIYSLGCTLYRLLTGKPIYRGELMMQLLIAHREHAIPSLRAARPEIPEELEVCYQRMVAKKPEDRYQSMAEVAAALEGVLLVLSGQGASVSAETSSAAFAKDWSFLQDASVPGAMSKKKKYHGGDRTVLHPGAEHDTAANLAGKSRSKIAQVFRKPFVLVGLAVSVVALLAGIILMLTVPRAGSLVVAIDEPVAKNVQVAVIQGGQAVGLVDAKSNWSLSLSPGQYSLVIQGGDGHLQLDSDQITIARGAPANVRITRKLGSPDVVHPDVNLAYSDKKVDGVKPMPKDSGSEKPMSELVVARPLPAKATESPPVANDPAAEKPKPDVVAMAGPSPDKAVDAKLPVDADEVAAKKIEPPSAEDQKRLIREVDELYKPDDAKDQPAKAAMALKLLEEGRNNKTDRAEQFVLLRRAGEVACSAVEPDMMLDAVDAISAAGFDIQPYQVKARFLKRIVQQAASGTASQQSAVSETCVKFAEEAVANGAVDEAADVLDADKKSLLEPGRRAQSAYRLAQTAMNRARNPSERTEREKKVIELQGDLDTIKSAQTALADCAKDLQQARKDNEAIQATLEKLKTSPDDPELCLAAGRWYCFTRNDWDRGLKLLAKGSDTALKTLADEELTSKPATADERVARGDAWWDLGEKAAGKAKAALRRHSAQWYQAAMPDVAVGAAKTKLEKRLAQASLGADGKSARPPLASAPFNEKTAKSLQARWAKFLRMPVVQTNSIGMKLTIIPPGEFDMGSPKELTEAEARAWPDGSYVAHMAGEVPRHHVRITKPYWFGVTKVTQEEFERVMGNNPSKFPGDSKRPVEQVTWDEASEFCRRLSDLPGEKSAKRQYRLPTEAQWEHACRAGNPGPWFFSPPANSLQPGWEEKLLTAYAWTNSNAADQTHAVAQKQANGWGLYDLYGNVWEWCQDWYDLDYYQKSPTDDPQGPSGGSDRAMRGGSFSAYFRQSRSAYRIGSAGSRRFDTSIGFRISLVQADK